MSIAVYPGSFDPVTSGHIDVIKRATELYDQVVVGVAVKPPRRPAFSLEERIDFLKEAFLGNDKVTVEAFDSLVVEFAEKHKARAIVRGLRAVSDFEHEFQMAQMNRKLNSNVETVFIMASPEYAYVSSSAVKEVAEYGGNIKGLVPKKAEESLKAVFKK